MAKKPIYFKKNYNTEPFTNETMVVYKCTEKYLVSIYANGGMNIGINGYDNIPADGIKITATEFKAFAANRLKDITKKCGLQWSL